MEYAEYPRITFVSVNGVISGNNILGSSNSSVSVQGNQDNIFSDDIVEILRIAKILDPKRRHKLLGVAFELEEEG